MAHEQRRQQLCLRGQPGLVGRIGRADGEERHVTLAVTLGVRRGLGQARKQAGAHDRVMATEWVLQSHRSRRSLRFGQRLFGGERIGHRLGQALGHRGSANATHELLGATHGHTRTNGRKLLGDLVHAAHPGDLFDEIDFPRQIWSV